MHELSIAQSILAIAGKVAPRGNASISSVALQVGELSGVEVEALKFAFSVAREDTVLKHADLDIEVIGGEAECTQCGTVFPMHYFGSCCPQCRSYFVTVRKGRELKVLNIVVEDEEMVDKR